LQVSAAMEIQTLLYKHKTVLEGALELLDGSVAELLDVKELLLRTTAILDEDTTIELELCTELLLATGQILTICPPITEQSLETMLMQPPPYKHQAMLNGKLAEEEEELSLFSIGGGRGSISCVQERNSETQSTTSRSNR